MERLLIIESNEKAKTVLANYFSKRYLVTLVSTPTEALAWLKTERASMIVSASQETDSYEYSQLNAIKTWCSWTNVILHTLEEKDKSEDGLSDRNIGTRRAITKTLTSYLRAV
tara:strand:+ start:271 stop:609 length:339 start_codon:yes stop_codon:yes gene_type:complete